MLNICPAFQQEVESKWQQFLIYLREWGFQQVANHLDNDNWKMREDFYLLFEDKEAEEAAIDFALEYMYRDWADA